MTLSTGKQIMTIHILPNISRSKNDNKITNLSLEKSCAICVGVTSARSFYTKSDLSISLDQQSEI